MFALHEHATNLQVRVKLMVRNRFGENEAGAHFKRRTHTGDAIHDRKYGGEPIGAAVADSNHGLRPARKVIAINHEPIQVASLTGAQSAGGVRAKFRLDAKRFQRRLHLFEQAVVPGY